jgi:ribosome-associated protein
MKEDYRSGLDKTIVEIAEFLRSKKAQDIIVLDLNGKTSITDFFIICTVNSSVQTRALVRYIEEYMKDMDIRPLSKGSVTDSPWVLLDYNDFIIHIFLQEGRDYYRLEKLWSDAKIVYDHAGGIL